MKIVLDTNCLLQIVLPEAYHHNVWNSFRSKEFTLCVTNEILTEYREVLERRFKSIEFADMVILLLMSVPNVEYVHTSFRFDLIKADKDDNKFVDCAIAAGATYVVSDDKHFRELDKIDWPKVVRLTLSEFHTLLKHSK